MTEPEVRWTRTAQRDMNAIVVYMAEDSADNALAVLDRLDLPTAILSWYVAIFRSTRSALVRSRGSIP